MLAMLLAVLRVTAAVIGVVLAAALTKMVYVFFEQRRSYAVLQKRFKGPVTWPWGGAFERFKSGGNFIEMHYNFIKQYGSETRSYLLLDPIFARGAGGSRNEIVTADPVLVKHVLHDKFDSYTKSTIDGRVPRGILNLLGHGIFVADHGPHAAVPRDGGKSWRLQRRTALQTFSRSLFQSSYEQVFLEHGNRLIDLLKKEVCNGVATVNIQSYFFKYTMDAIGQIAFGERLGSLGVGKDAFGNAFDQANAELGQSLRQSLPMSVFCSLFPDVVGDVFLSIYETYFLPPHKAFLQQVAILDAYCYEIIARRRTKLAENSKAEEKPDLLGYFVAAQGEDGKSLYSDKDLRDMVMSFILAGRDTTASLLSWIFFEISLPENEVILEALLSEIDTVLSGQPPTYDALQDLPYLRGVVWEALRLHPVVPLTIMYSKVPDTLPDGTEVPAGTRISIQSYTMTRDKDRWGDDADEFKPDRWIPFKQPSPYEFPQFKAGPRICLGRDMALYEASFAAIIVLQSFRPVAAYKRADIRTTKKLTTSCEDVASGKEELRVHLHVRQSNPRS